MKRGELHYSSQCRELGKQRDVLCTEYVRRIYETISAHKISAAQPEGRRTLSTVSHKYEFQIDHPQKKKNFFSAPHCVELHSFFFLICLSAVRIHFYLNHR